MSDNRKHAKEAEIKVLAESLKNFSGDHLTADMIKKKIESLGEIRSFRTKPVDRGI